MKNSLVIPGLLFFLFMCRPLTGQEDTVLFNYDLALKVAHELAWDGKYEEARMLCTRILRDKPEYIDARLLNGKVLAWQNQFEEARREFYNIFDYDNGNLNALLALADLEIWAGKPETAAQVAMTGLDNYPDNLELLVKHARASQLSGDFAGSKKSVYRVLQLDPTNEEARKIYNEIRTSVPVSTEGLVLPGISGPYEIVNVDTLYSQAQRCALNQEYGEARRLTNQILLYRPDYIAARVLNAQTYAWGNEFESARRELEPVKVEETGNREGILTWIDVEKWDRNYSKALNYCNLGLRFFPGDEDFLLRKAEVYNLSGETLQAKKILFTYLSAHPNNTKFLQAYNALGDVNQPTGLPARQRVSDEAKAQSAASDSLYKIAREEAFGGNFLAARLKCQQILQTEPDNFDTKFLMGNIYAWEQNFDQARIIYDELIAKVFDSYDLILAMTNLEMWAQNYNTALSRIQYGLEIFPDDPELIFKRAIAYQKSGRMDLANKDLGKLMQLDPTNPVYQNAFYSPREPLLINGVSLEYTLNRYDKPVSRSFNMISGRYYRSNNSGTYIGSINAGYLASDTNQFMQNAGLQFEFDAYPIVPSRKQYFHLNYAFSPSSLFARHKFGVHAFADIGQSWELSGGFDYMIYRGTRDSSNVFIADIGLTKYFRDVMAGLVISLSPNTGKIAQGYTFTFRKFFNTPYDWIQFSVGTGIYPDNPLNYFSDPDYIPNQLLRSYNVLFAVRYKFAEKWIGRVYAGFQYEEYKVKTFRDITNLNLAVIYLL